MSDNSNRTIRWGIMGPGSIARRFTEGLKALPDADLAAVGSRDKSRAEAFATEHGYKRTHGSYQELVNDPEVDVIYVATPHNGHYEGCMMALDAGKAVLCEKPFMMNSKQSAEVIAKARANKLFLMEGMWTRCFPIFDKLRSLLKEEVIGKVWLLDVDFGFRAGYNPESRLFDPVKGGGGLMDVGVYCVSLASMIFGTPDKVEGMATLGLSGVDEVAAINLHHTDGSIAMLSTTLRANTPSIATLCGENGSIVINSAWWCPAKLTVKVNGKETEVIEMPFEGGGFQFEAAEVQRCVREGLTECPIMPLDETVQIMKTLDTLRSLWGVRYPSDNE